MVTPIEQACDDIHNARNDIEYLQARARFDALILEQEERRYAAYPKTWEGRVLLHWGESIGAPIRTLGLDDMGDNMTFEIMSDPPRKVKIPVMAWAWGKADFDSLAPILLKVSKV